jgi:hypothetical protein
MAVTRDLLHLIWLDARDGNTQVFYRRASRHPADKER